MALAKNLNLGTKSSTRRAEVWDRIVQPISGAAKRAGTGGYTTSRRQWLLKSATGVKAQWRKARVNARTLAEMYGMSDFDSETSMGTLDGAAEWAGRLLAEVQAERAARVVDSDPGYSDSSTETDWAAIATGDGYVPPVDSGTVDGTEDIPEEGEAGMSGGMKLALGIGAGLLAIGTVTTVVVLGQRNEGYDYY